MKWNLSRLSLAVLAGCLAATTFARAQAPAVELMRVPDGGTLPQACVDSVGTIHLIYCKGGMGPGDLFYVRMRAGEKEFSEPIRVNSEPASAVVWGPSTGGGQLALGKSGRVHVAWNGPAPPKPKGERAGAHPKGKEGGSMLYARMNDAGSAFEPQRAIEGQTEALDGGGTVAADGEGNVYVLWQARGEQMGEQFRTVYMTRSTDEGKTFEKEKRVNPGPTGACSCCSVRALTDPQGRLYAAYRAAGEGVRRDSILLFSSGGGSPFEELKLGSWNVNYCPASSYGLTPTASGVLAAWESQGQIHFAAFDWRTRHLSKTVRVGGAGSKLKYPVVAENTRGDKLVAWAEGVLWNKGGSAAWQIYGANDEPIGSRGETGGVPASSHAAAFVRPDGSFVLVY